MRSPLAPAALDQLFLEARSRNGWSDRPVADADIERIYELAKFGPTAANSTPARFVWIRSPEAKRRLEPLLMENNRVKTMAAPATVIVAYDVAFAPTMARLFPHVPGAADWFAGERGEAEAHSPARLDDLPLFAAARPEPVRVVEPSAAEKALKALDPDAMSPREALEALYRLKDLA